MTTSIHTSQRMDGAREEQSNIARGLSEEQHIDEADSYITKTNATLLDWGEVWQCQLGDMYWFN